MDITDSDKSNNDVLITVWFRYIAVPKSLYPEDSGVPGATAQIACDETECAGRPWPPSASRTWLLPPFWWDSDHSRWCCGEANPWSGTAEANLDRSL